MWIIMALLSAFFAGITSILAKCGIRKTDSTVATAIRTIVVLLMSGGMVAIAGSAGTVASISAKSWVFLILSGIATGASWLCYFRALQIGNVNQVVPIDKSSTILSILLACVFLGEWKTWSTAEAVVKPMGIVLIAVGTYAMLPPRKSEKTVVGRWMLYAVLSAVFAALTSILGKVGISGVESNLGTFIRTAVVLVLAWAMVPVAGKSAAVKRIDRRELGFILLSGLATGASWLCYYKALQDGPASVVVPIDKLSILVTVAFSHIVFGERLTRRSAVGLALIAAGTLGLAVPLAA